MMAHAVLTPMGLGIPTALPCPALRCPAPHRIALHCPALPCPALPCSALHGAALHCPARHAPPHTAVPCTALPCPALPCTALPCPALPYPALPCRAPVNDTMEGCAGCLVCSPTSNMGGGKREQLAWLGQSWAFIWAHPRQGKQYVHIYLGTPPKAAMPCSYSCCVCISGCCAATCPIPLQGAIRADLGSKPPRLALTTSSFPPFSHRTSPSK